MLRLSRGGAAVKPVAIALVLLMGLSACQGTRTGSRNYGYYPTPQEQLLAQRQSRYNQTVGEGALAGAALGALIGGLTGDWEGAAIGAASGALVGGVAGYFVAEENASYANREAALDGQIRQARAQVSEYQQDLVLTRQLVANRRQRIAEVNAALRSGQISQAQYRAEISQVQGSISTIQQNIQAHERNIQLIQADIAQFQRQGYNTSALQSELNRYRALRDEQQSLLYQLIQASQA